MTPFVDFGRKTQYSAKNAMGDTKSALPILLERNQKHFAISDYGECSGWVNQYFICVKNGITPILGMETFVNNYRTNISDLSDDPVVNKIGEEEWEKHESEISDDELDWSQIDFSLDIFARTMEGYYNVIKIHNDAQINGVQNRPRVSDKFLKEHGKGIVALMPTPYSEFSSYVYNRDFVSARKKYDFYKSVFDEVYVEIPILEDGDYRAINSDMIAFCLRNHINMVPVINSHYNLAEDEEAFEIFKKCGKLRGGMSYEVDYASGMYMKTAEEVYDTFMKYHKSEVFTEEVMRMLFLNLNKLCSSFTTLELDTSPKTPHFDNSDHRLRYHAWRGFVKYGFNKMGDVYRERMEYELKNIVGAGFADYFLLIEQMFDWHINQMHRLGSIGRGSAAGSLVLRCLGVTKIDPVKHNLLFERFLDASRLNDIVNNGGKVSGADFPDVDSDFQSNAKEGVKDFFADNYGKNNICSVGTVGYLHVKSTLKELGRVYGIDDKEINDLTTSGLKEFVAKDDDGKPLEELREKFPSLDEFLRKYPKVESVFKKLQGTINCWGVHAGGILISDKPLIDQLPVRVNDGKLVSCWSEGLNGRELGEMGFLKLDLLAIETLDIIEDAINLINERHGSGTVDFDTIMEIMINDKDLRALSRIDYGHNQGVFQFETPLALRVCKDMRGLRTFDDIAMLSTLMRPAALQNGYGEIFGKRRDGEEKIEVPECVKSYMEKEYGVPAFQESVYHFCLHMAGFDKVNSYLLMKKMYKKKLTNKEDVKKWHDKFVYGCVPKIKHMEYDVEFEDGTKKRFTEYEKLKCVDGIEHTIKEIVENNLEIVEN